MKSTGNIVALFLFLALVTSWVQPFAQDVAAPLAPPIGTDLVPRGAIDAWESYPFGLLRDKGNKVATIEPGATYTVTGTKVIEVLLFGDQYYVQITPKSADASDWASAWVFQGKDGADLPPNLLPKGVVCQESSLPKGYECKKD